VKKERKLNLSKTQKTAHKRGEGGEKGITAIHGGKSIASLRLEKTEGVVTEGRKNGDDPFSIDQKEGRIHQI